MHRADAVLGVVNGVAFQNRNDLSPQCSGMLKKGKNKLIIQYLTLFARKLQSGIAMAIVT